MSAKLGQKRGSYKPASTQALVISKRREDKSIRRIARETGLARETVTNILSQPEIKEALEAARRESILALPAISRMVHQDTLAERDRELGFRILDKAGVYPEQKAPTFNFNDDAQLQVAIQTLLPPPTNPDWIAAHQAAYAAQPVAVTVAALAASGDGDGKATAPSGSASPRRGATRARRIRVPIPR